MFALRLDAEVSLGLLQPHHAQLIFAVVDGQRDYLRTWLPWVDSTKTSMDIEDFIRRSLVMFAQQGNPQCGIWYQDEFVGSIGLHRINEEDRATTMGYWLSQFHQGRGIMTRACLGMLDYIFDELQLNRVVIVAGVENYKSRAIPQRLGFTEEGIQRQAHRLNGRYIDTVRYGLLAADWAVIQEKWRA